MAEQLLKIHHQKKSVISKVFFHQSGQSPKIIRAKGVGLERTDSQTVGEFPRGRRKGRYFTLICHCLSENLSFFELDLTFVQTRLHLKSLHVVVIVLYNYRPVGSVREQLC